MSKYYRKICIVLFIILAMSFIICLVCLPLGIRDTINNLETMMKQNNVTPEKITLQPEIDTLSINDDYYYFFDVIYKQSPDDTAYIEIYGNDIINHSKFEVNYIDNHKAFITSSRNYGNFTFDQQKIKQTIVKQLQNYPDVVVFIPKRLQIETEYPYVIPENIEYKNKETLIAAFEQKQKEEEALERLQIQEESALERLEILEDALEQIQIQKEDALEQIQIQKEEALEQIQIQKQDALEQIQIQKEEALE